MSGALLIYARFKNHSEQFSKMTANNDEGSEHDNLKSTIIIS